MLFGGASASADDMTLQKNVDKLIQLQPGLSKDEVKQTISDYAYDQNTSEFNASKEILTELKEQYAADKEEQNQIIPFGGSSGTKKLVKSRHKGDVFYTPSSTLGIQHGHNGIYSTTNEIVESIPKKGVRVIKYNGRNVEKNAVMQEVSVSQSKRSSAASWAKSRKGDSYSYNFATNRLTGHYGAKNCAKLLWSAYKLKASIDIDHNKGAGVYPKDIKNSGYTKTYKTIK
nr:hypothetical protein [Pullulanibacillus pueri]